MGRLLELGLDPLRLSAYWEEVDATGYGALDWQLDEAVRAGRGILLTVGMKAQGWPEFAIPPRLLPLDAPAAGDVTLRRDDLTGAALAFLRATVHRYRGHPALIGWQVENEPLNPSGPKRWWIGTGFLREEIAAVRELDPGRPLAINVFTHFNRRVDVAASRQGFQLGRCRPECEVLSLLQPGDILGLDVYRRIGFRLGPLRLVTHAGRGWASSAGSWRERASAAGMRAWIVEAQAEPWGPPRTCRPGDVGDTVRSLRRAGFDTVLLWGAEHWLARDAAGDGSWLAAVARIGRVDAG